MWLIKCHSFYNYAIASEFLVVHLIVYIQVTFNVGYVFQVRPVQAQALVDISHAWDW